MKTQNGNFHVFRIIITEKYISAHTVIISVISYSVRTHTDITKGKCNLQVAGNARRMMALGGKPETEQIMVTGKIEVGENRDSFVNSKNKGGYVLPRSV